MSTARSHRRRPAIPALVTALVALVALTVAAGGEAAGPAEVKQPPPLPAPASFGPALVERVVSARVFHTRISVVRNANTRKIGRSLATLRPTWVTGLLRYRRGQFPTRKEARGWEEIRRIVRTYSPGSQFDVVLNALQYRTPKAIRTEMARMRAKLGNEGWFFDFLSSAFKKHPRMVRAMVNSAHAHGEWVGGNVFGLAKRRKLPHRVDFYSVQDAVFRLNLGEARRLASSKPVVYHLNNNPAHQRSGGCRFIEGLSTTRRKRLIKLRAFQQLQYGFRFSYPAYFPECQRARPRGPGSFLYSYNAFRDPPVADVIREMLNLYDFSPAT